VRRLPRSVRAIYEATWLKELAAIPEVERLTYAQGIHNGLRLLKRELDPEGAFISDLLTLTAGMGMILTLLPSLGVVSPWPGLLAGTVGWGIGVFLLSHLTTKGVLALRELLRVWWRLLSMCGLIFVCGYLALACLLWWTVQHPQMFLLMVLCSFAGVGTGRHFHVPRPPLAR